MNRDEPRWARLAAKLSALSMLVAGGAGLVVALAALVAVLVLARHLWRLIDHAASLP